ncbi:hypothetical protein ABDK56_05185 [Sphingomonas sp. ASV193]|uniref:hypothetical protein n=1 Tax=Sphingomonas sp. ASV193 TaxID=3144405 RepID=UPI0032E85C03
MNQADAFLAFYTLLLGLGVAALLTGLAGTMRQHRLREIGWAGALLAILIVFEFLTAWSGAARGFRSADAHVIDLFLPLGTGACYFVAATLLFPDPADVGREGHIRAYVGGQVRTVAAMLLAANVLLIVQEAPDTVARMARNPAYLATFYLPYNGAILLSYAAMMAAPRRRVAVAAMAVLLAIYLWVTFIRHL